MGGFVIYMKKDMWSVKKFANLSENNIFSFIIQYQIKG